MPRTSAVRRAILTRPFVSLLLLAFSMNLVIESLARLSPFGGIAHLLSRPVPFLANTLVLFSTLSLCLLFRRRIFALAAVAAVWGVLGITNAVVIFLRRSPLSGIDFAILRSCLPIVKVYLTGWQAALILLFLLSLAAAAVFFFRRSRKYEVRWQREVALFLSAVLLTTGVFALSVKTGAVETGFSDLPTAYEDYGFVTCFSLTVFQRGISEPEEYGPQSLEALARRLEEIPEEEGGAPGGSRAGEEDGRPNLVVVQLESFMDPNRLAGAVYSDNPDPVFTELKERYPSGFLRVNTVGAGTANTEFEVLTGIDLGFFGSGEYPYQTTLDAEGAVCESAASDASAAGYATCAVHNHSASFYNRYIVYGALGFDCFVPLEYMNGVEENPLGWAKDKILTQILEERMEDTAEADFCFAVSVQGHGLYPDSFPDPSDASAASGEPGTDADSENEAEPLRVLTVPAGLTSGGSGAADSLSLFSGRTSRGGAGSGRPPVAGARAAAAQLTYYVNQVREMDSFLGELIAMLEERAERTGEKTLVLLYGDHLPPLSFGEGAFSDGSDSLDSEYVIVPVGYGDGESPFPEGFGDRDLEAWEAGMRLLSLAGIDEGAINRCHRLPDGEEAEAEPEKGGESPKRRAIRLLAYDMLYGSRYAWGGEDPFERKPLAMGLPDRPIRVTDAVTLADPAGEGASGLIPGEEELLAVYGENFTPFSVVTVNGRAKKTTFVSPFELRAETSAAPGDRIAVIQRTEDYIVLGETEEITKGQDLSKSARRANRRSRSADAVAMP